MKERDKVKIKTKGIGGRIIGTSETVFGKFYLVMTYPDLISGKPVSLYTEDELELVVSYGHSPVDYTKLVGIPLAPEIPQAARCSKCGIDLSSPMGYVCASSQCPVGLGGFTC